MAKKVNGLRQAADARPGRPTPSPPVGPALGQQGVNIMEFCKQFNAQTQKIEKGLPISGGDHGVQRPQLHLHHEDAARLGADPQGDRHREGQRPPNTNKVGKITRKQLEDIAKVKMPDLTAAEPRRRRPYHRRQRAQHGRGRGG